MKFDAEERILRIFREAGSKIPIERAALSRLTKISGSTLDIAVLNLMAAGQLYVDRWGGIQPTRDFQYADRDTPRARRQHARIMRVRRELSP